MTLPTHSAASVPSPSPSAPPAREGASLHGPVIAWYEANARDLPWRRPEAGAWGVMVSEFMLQQTPVARVLPVYEEWMRRWPRPADLAKEPSGEAVRAWGRLGYPRRALRLHGAAVAITERHGGDVPEHHAQLLALPGIGEYTAAAVASFAYGQRHAVLDTNVRRVLARAVSGEQFPPNATTAAERRLARSVLPEDEDTAARWAAASMELGALVCTAKGERCESCPLSDRCAWRLAGKPEHTGPPRRAQTYAGTDRQVRGKLLAVLREALEPVPQATLDRVWHDPVQRARALDGLVADGLVEPLENGRYRLPGHRSFPPHQPR
ncbi:MULTISPECIES: A/G-specific adenine glycosylase [unclassified Streptomyces]|uniref:A/G-specific adenine glycosylase n=1 Tax=unclassified Streptomyces TaxID=2593676 RepID=UPI0002D5D338|nr:MULTISPECIES: A/G-specific adenine glycosylase [unclassified Streptomyces]NJA58720.1 A/G-specific adenine glycosylase [Streptomyces sp. NEAU-H3]WEH29014.1 A/G-specific adenine glycosylase [Streptomyces sp. AM 3-1-1]SCD30973.1 A/G-specific DNA-adenine glycosylase [Streptomyces sp. TverLS-915]SCE66095.1 A/G-specific DNA-adenine glycosylase [Streptomyces sp. LcepLS]